MTNNMDNTQEPTAPELNTGYADQALRVEITPLGPDQAAIDKVKQDLTQHPSVQAHLQGAPHQLLSFELDQPDTKDETSLPLTPPSNYRAMIYDYANSRTLVVRGSLDQPDVLDVSPSGTHPLPSSDEFNAAVAVLSQEPTLGPAIKEAHLQPYQPMPPLLEHKLPDGRSERVIIVGLLPTDKDHQHEIVGVNMNNQTIARFDNRAPGSSLANSQTCGPAGAPQPNVPRGSAGQAKITVYRGNTVLWSFVAVRPAASSATNGSGIELRYVDYLGKRVLYRAHVPILNVRYDHDACGPYRDWQWSESAFQANGTDVTPGFRLCTAPAQTMLDSETDGGNFNGVAVYVEGQEVVLVSQMRAGWYRYISEWRLAADGTIRPRFGFSAVRNSCVCNLHHHHVYWRFDFDIRTPGNNIVREYNDPPIIGLSNWHTKLFEIKRPRDAGHNRLWRVENILTGEGYSLIPGPNDGTADSDFGVGDVWVLRYRSTELDDGQGFTTNVLQARANVDKFVDGEPVLDQDVVIWYAAHFTHDINVDVGHIVGPELVPFNW